MNTKARLVINGSLFALLLGAFGTGPACSPASSGGGAGTTGASGTTGSGTGAAGTTGSGTGASGTTGSGTGASGTTGSGTGVAGTTGSGTGVAGTTGSGTGAAGTTGSGTGVAGATGAGGTGAVVVQKLCATKTVVMNPMLVNFDNYDGTVLPAMYGTAFGGTTAGTGTAYAGPYVYPEGTGTPTPTLALLAGHPPSAWALSETLAATQWGMGGGLWMSSCADASAYKGISFWVRGTAPLSVFSFSISMENTELPNATNPAGGGTCPGTADTCKPVTKTNVPLTADWTQVQILWADFTPGMSGTTAVVPNGNNITGFGWSVPLQFQLDPAAGGDAAGPYIPVPASLELQIDEIAFIP
jgi:hypothetical protein